MSKGLYRYKKKPARRMIPVKTNYSPRLALGLLFFLCGAMIIFIYFFIQLFL